MNVISTPSDPGPLDADLLAAISEGLTPRLTQPPALLQRLKARIDDAIGFEADHRYLAADGGDWRVLATGIFLKVLDRDADSGQASYLVRYSAGTSFPKHPQRSTEECLLVAGDLRIGDIHMQPGDLQIAVPGIEHGPLVSCNGALVFVRGVLTSVPEQRQTEGHVR